MKTDEIEKQIKLMTQYAQMMLDRADYHGLWDAAIDLQRLFDKLDHIPDVSKMRCERCSKYEARLTKDKRYLCWSCEDMVDALKNFDQNQNSIKKKHCVICHDFFSDSGFKDCCSQECAKQWAWNKANEK